MNLVQCMKCSGSRLEMDIVGGRNRNHEGRQWIVRWFVRSLVTQFVVRSSFAVRRHRRRRRRRWLSQWRPNDTFWRKGRTVEGSEVRCAAGRLVMCDLESLVGGGKGTRGTQRKW